MKYSPVTLLFRDGDEIVDASSGIYLSENDDYIFSILKDSYDGKRIRVSFTCNEMINRDQVKWRNLPEDGLGFKEIDCEELNNFFESCRISGSKKRYLFFSKIPSYLKIRNELKGITIVENNTFREQLPLKVKIESCPFGLTNAEIFHGYTNFGYLNFEGVNNAFWLSDSKCMENMNGGVVSVAVKPYDTYSIGCIWGNLKWGDHGELMVIISWEKLLTYLPFKITTDLVTNKSLKILRIPEDNMLTEDVSRHVVSLRVKHDNGTISWGSGVIVDNGLIATNKHVITGDSSKNDLPQTIEIFYHLGDSSSGVNKRVEIEMPVLGLNLFMSLKRDDHDICFVKCTNPELMQNSGFDIVGGGKLRNFRQSSQLSNITRQPGKNELLRVGDATISIGYGLFLQEDDQGFIRAQPLHSLGNVTKIHGDMELILNSSSCWSGCSGGAVTNEAGELVAIMANNARDVVTGEVLPSLNFAIGIGILSACYREQQPLSTAKL